MLPEHTVDGRVAVITGGGTGIGFGIARELSRLAGGNCATLAPRTG